MAVVVRVDRLDVVGEVGLGDRPADEGLLADRADDVTAPV